MPSARGLALYALLEFEQGSARYLREALDRAKLESREQAFASELAHGVMRHERFLDFVLKHWTPRGLPKDPQVLLTLRLGAHQLLFVPGMPPHAAVHETVGLLRHNKSFANAVLRKVSGMVADRAADPARADTEVALSPTRTLVLPEPGLAAGAGGPDPLALRHSLPDFLVARWRANHGDAVASICAAASARPEVFLRNCAPQCRPEQLLQRLADEGVGCEVTGHPRVLRWAGGQSPFASGAFADGWFVAQDPTAVTAAEAVPLQSGQSVLDLCAAPGTKATLLAEAVGSEGVVHAHDRDTERLVRIRENAARLRLPQLRVVEDLAAVPPVDAVLVDVPCSNTGVIARRVEVRRRLWPQSIAQLAAEQRALLQEAVLRVRPGGAVVYSTCSIEPEENGELVRAALPAGFHLEREQLTLPRASECDGGYFAVLRAADRA